MHACHSIIRSEFSTVTGSLPDGKGDIYYDKVYYLDANANYFINKKVGALRQCQ